MEKRFEISASALVGSACQRQALAKQWIAIPEEVRTPSAVEKLLRSQPWGGWLAPGRLTFLRDGFEISDSTVCMVRADVIKVALADELYAFAEGSASELHHRAQDPPRALSRNAAGSDPASGVGVSGHPLCGEGDHSAPRMEPQVSQPAPTRAPTRPMGVGRSRGRGTSPRPRGSSHLDAACAAIVKSRLAAGTPLSLRGQMQLARQELRSAETQSSLPPPR